MNANGEYEEIPSEVIHGLVMEGDLLQEPDTYSVSAAEVKQATGTRTEEWKAALEKEHHENFVERNMFTVTTAEERRQHGPPLPMRLVFTM